MRSNQYPQSLSPYPSLRAANLASNSEIQQAKGNIPRAFRAEVGKYVGRRVGDGVWEAVNTCCESGREEGESADVEGCETEEGGGC